MLFLLVPPALITIWGSSGCSTKSLEGVFVIIWKTRREPMARYYQESRLNLRTVSPAGAREISQFMPRTWAEVSTIGDNYGNTDQAQPIGMDGHR